MPSLLPLSFPSPTLLQSPGPLEQPSSSGPMHLLFSSAWEGFGPQASRFYVSIFSLKSCGSGHCEALSRPLCRSGVLVLWQLGDTLLSAPLRIVSASQVAQLVTNLPAMQEIRVPSLGQEDLLEKEMATHSSISFVVTPIGKGAWQATVHGATMSQTRLSG